MERVVRSRASAGNSRLSAFPIGRALRLRCRRCAQLSDDLCSCFRGSDKNSGIRESARLGAVQGEDPLYNAPVYSIEAPVNQRQCPMSDDAETWYFRRRWDGFRSGERLVRLMFAAEQATARLYDKGVPQTCCQILAHLPLTVPVVHVAWSGDMVMSAQPFNIGPREPENAVRLPRPGDLTWDPKFGEICFAYG